MQCPQCGSETTPGAAFCGNCGAILAPAPPPAVALSAPAANQAALVSAPTVPAAPISPPALPASPVAPVVPAALPRHTGSRKAVAALLLGVIGLAGWLVPILGLAIGVAAIIFGTTSLHTARRHLAVAGTVLGCISVVFALAAWAYFAQNLKHNSVATREAAVASQGIETVCYGTSAEVTLQPTSSSAATCMYDANDVASGDEYTIKGLMIAGLSSANLAEVSRSDIDNFIRNYPNVSVDTSEPGFFADSPALIYHLGNSSGQTATVLYVLHDSPSGYNLFIVARFANGSNASLEKIEKNWRWK